VIGPVTLLVVALLTGMFAAACLRLLQLLPCLIEHIRTEAFLRRMRREDEALWARVKSGTATEWEADHYFGFDLRRRAKP